MSHDRDPGAPGEPPGRKDLPSTKELSDEEERELIARIERFRTRMNNKGQHMLEELLPLTLPGRSRAISVVLETSYDWHDFVLDLLGLRQDQRDDRPKEQ